MSSFMTTRCLAQLTTSKSSYTLLASACWHTSFMHFVLLQSTYTGVYANGGPTNVNGKADLSELCDRSDANVRGVTQKFANSH